MIKVKAKELGYYGAKRRRPGDVFEIQNESDRGNWMINVDDPMPPRKTAMPLTSNVQGTRAGGNLNMTGKDPWEEPVGESIPRMPEYDTPEEKQPKKTSKRRK